MKENILTIKQFNEFTNWDVKQFLSRSLKSHYTIDRLGNYIIHQTKKYKLSDFPDKKFIILGVSNKIGMFDGDVLEGKNIKQKYHKVESNWIAYNPYRVNVGSIGLKTKDIKGEYISPAYVVFSCNEKLLPEFLLIMMKTKAFNEMIRNSTTGTVRQTLGFDNLTEINIPIPPIEKQKEIVEKYYEYANCVEINENVKILEKQFNDEFIKELMVSNYEYKAEDAYYFTTRSFATISRWDISNDIKIMSKKYNIVDFANVVLDKPQYGANMKGTDIENEYRYIRITDIDSDGNLNSEIKYPEKIDNNYILNENDFLIARSGNTVGKTFLYKNKYGKAIYAGYLVKYIIDNRKVIPEYLLYYTKSIIFKNWVLKNQRISGQPNINGQEYMKFPLILPPIDKQKEMVKKLSELLKKKIEIRREIQSRTNKASMFFEKDIYKV